MASPARSRAWNRLESTLFCPRQLLQQVAAALVEEVVADALRLLAELRKLRSHLSERDETGIIHYEKQDLVMHE